MGSQEQNVGAGEVVSEALRGAAGDGDGGDEEAEEEGEEEEGEGSGGEDRDGEDDEPALGPAAQVRSDCRLVGGLGKPLGRGGWAICA